MTHEEIINAWFAIDELGGENVHTELSSLHYCGKEGKIYSASIRFAFYTFVTQDTDRYKAMERAINEYSEWVIQNSK